MAGNQALDAPTRAIGADMVAAIDSGQWSKFEHYFVTAKWDFRRDLRMGRGLVRGVAGSARIIKSLL